MRVVRGFFYLFFCHGCRQCQVVYRSDVNINHKRLSCFLCLILVTTLVRGFFALSCNIVSSLCNDQGWPQRGSLHGQNGNAVFFSQRLRK